MPPTRTALRVTGLSLLLLSFQALGTVYADVGTSPLYALGGIWSPSSALPTHEDVIGVISAIVWSLTIVPLIKYTFITLYFGTHEGEGGPFALYQGLFPHRQSQYDTDTLAIYRSITVHTNEDSWAPRISKRLKWPLLVWSLFGTSLTMADGVLTTAVSITSAVAGIEVAKPSVSSHVVPISIAVIIVFFLAQPLGTQRLSTAFAPIMLLWMVMLAATGIVNIAHGPTVFRALDPSRAIMYFVRTGNYDALSGVLLALTGSEALFANLGQFNVASIQLSFSLVIYPSLILAYLGQGARLITGGQDVLSNIFFKTIPGGHNGALYWILFVLGILATLIASQSMVTATFSLTQQLVNLKSLPPIRIVHTSSTMEGQVYIPSVNWILMVATIAVVGGFKSSASLTHAFGFAVATVMFSTTALLAVHMRYVKHWPVVIGIAFFAVFGFVDGLFWGVALKKVPDGAWLPLTLGVILLALMTSWTWAKALEDRFDSANRKHLRNFIIPDEKGEPRVVRTPELLEDYEETASPEGAQPELHSGASVKSSDGRGDHELLRMPTCALFHNLSSGRAPGVPHSFVHFVRQWPSLPRVVVFLSVRVLPVARVNPEDRYRVQNIHIVEGFYAATYVLGFQEAFDVKVDEIIERICALEMGINPEEAAEKVKMIKQYAQTSTHIIPNYDIASKKVCVGKASFIINRLRKLLIEQFYRPLTLMFPESYTWANSADELIHVGVPAII